MLPLDALLAFVYFDLNFCGYLHRRDLEKILLTLGLHLCKEQVRARAGQLLRAQALAGQQLHLYIPMAGQAPREPGGDPVCVPIPKPPLQPAGRPGPWHY